MRTKTQQPPSSKSYKTYGILLTVLSIPLIIMSLLLTIAIPFAGVIGMILGIVSFMYGRKYTKFSKNPPKSSATPIKAQTKTAIPSKETKLNPKTSSINFNAPLDRLDNGELPWGWINSNREFISKIQSEYKYFLNLYLDSRNKSPKQQYASLKSLILYLNDCKKLCASKGECHLKWFSDCIANDSYIQKRIEELRLLTSNFEEMTNTYNIRKETLPNLDKQILQYIRNNPGILQKDLYCNFDSCLKNDISKIIYYLSKNDKIKREKHGNTYKLFI